MKIAWRKTGFTREEMASIRDRAKAVGDDAILLDEWRRAFWALADAADRIDLMMGRLAAGE